MVDSSFDGRVPAENGCRRPNDAAALPATFPMHVAGTANPEISSTKISVAQCQALHIGSIKVIAIHNHTLAERQRLIFHRFWVVDDAKRRPGGIRKIIAAERPDLVCDHYIGGPRPAETPVKYGF